ncbi:MAG: cupin domain-containing protein [Chthoniobacterales bacterium]
MSSAHVFHTGTAEPQIKASGGTRLAVDAKNFPLLQRMAFYRLVLEPLGVREPHWHPNAHELTYCLSGSSLVTVFSNGSYRDSFTIEEGEMFFIPAGSLHHIENTGKGKAEFLLAFSHELPEDFGLSGTVGCMSDAVLGNTWGLPSSFFEGLKRSPEDIAIGKRSTPAEIPAEARRPSPLKFSAEKVTPSIQNPYGSAVTAKSSLWPALENLAMFSLRLKNTAMREPHWHPQTAEMGYVHKGRARMTVLSSGGKVDTYELGPGDLYFIPRAYPHHIENIGSEEIHFCIFFDQAMVQDIGFSGCIPAYSSEVLGATFNCAPDFFAKLPAISADLFIVERKNPVDP